MIRRFLAAAALLLASPAVPQTVTQTQAQSAAATVTTYAGETTAWACDPAQPDGFNPIWYALQRPDVVKLWGGTLLSHYQAYGKREGTPPCQAQAVTQAQDKAAAATLTAYLAQPIAVTAPVPTATAAPVVSKAMSYADLGPPALYVPEVWAPAGASDVRVRAYLFRVTSAGNQVAERSGDATARVQDNVSWFMSVDQPPRIMAPSNGGVKEYTVHIAQPGWTGHFTITLTDVGSNPGFSPVAATMHVGEAPPAGYAYPDALPDTPDLQPSAAVLASKPAVDADLSDLAGQGFKVGGYSLNSMPSTNSYFCAPGSVTASGKAVDPVPLVTEAGITGRRLMPQDFRHDLVATLAGFARWCAGAIQRDDHFVTGYRLTRELLYRYANADMAPSWTIGSNGQWPPELDDSEVWQASDKVARQSMTMHLSPDGRMRGATALGIPEGVWIDRLVQRAPEYTDDQGVEHPAMYRQWVRLVGSTGPWRLVYEWPDLLEGQALQWAANSELWEGGEPADVPGQPFDAVAAHAYMDLALYRLWR